MEAISLWEECRMRFFPSKCEKFFFRLSLRSVCVRRCSGAAYLMVVGVIGDDFRKRCYRKPLFCQLRRDRRRHRR